MTKIRGFDGIDKALTRLERSVRADVLVDVLNDSAEPIEHDYRVGAPDFLQRSVRTRVITKQSHRATTATGTKHPLAHIFEFGTRRRSTRGGLGRGKITKIGFGRRAFDTNVNRWFTNTGRLLWQRIRRVGR